MVETAPVKAEERKVERTAEVTATVTTPTEENASKENEVFKIRQPELGAKINVIGQIDLAALNQSTRPKKKSKEEKRREREEKEKVRQDQKKLMKSHSPFQPVIRIIPAARTSFRGASTCS